MPTPNDMLHKEIAKLRDQLDYAQEEIALYRSQVWDEAPLPNILGFTRAESRFLRILIKNHNGASYDLLSSAVSKNEDADVRMMINVLACKIRAKLSRIGVKFENIYGEGYRMMPPHRERLEEFIHNSNEEEIALAPVSPEALRAITPKRKRIGHNPNAPGFSEDFAKLAIAAAADYFHEEPEEIASGALHHSRSRFYAAQILLRKIIRWGEGKLVSKAVGFKGNSVYIPRDNFKPEVYAAIEARFDRLRTQQN